MMQMYDKHFECTTQNIQNNQKVNFFHLFLNLYQQIKSNAFGHPATIIYVCTAILSIKGAGKYIQYFFFHTHSKIA